MSKSKRFGKGTGGNSSGSKKRARKTNQTRLKKRTVNAKTGINKKTNKCFFILNSSSSSLVETYQTRLAAERVKLAGQKIYSSTSPTILNSSSQGAVQARKILKNLL